MVRGARIGGGGRMGHPHSHRGHNHLHHHHQRFGGRNVQPYIGDAMQKQRQITLINSGKSPQGLFATNYLFNSTDTALIARVDSLSSEQIKAMKNANLTIHGRIVQKFDSCCFVTTWVFGVCFIFPTCFFCCDCYKKRICPLYEVHPKGYEAISRLIQATTLQNLSITISDNALNAQKFGILMNALSSCKLKTFILVNRVIDIPLYGDQYDNLQQNASQLKALCQQRKIVLIIRWHGKVV